MDKHFQTRLDVITYCRLITNPKVDLPSKGSSVINICLKNYVAITLIKFSMCCLLNLVWQEIFNLPDGKSWDLTCILIKELRIVKRRFLKGFIPSLWPAMAKKIDFT